MVDCVFHAHVSVLPDREKQTRISDAVATNERGQLDIDSMKKSDRERVSRIKCIEILE